MKYKQRSYNELQHMYLLNLKITWRNKFGHINIVYPREYISWTQIGKNDYTKEDYCCPEYEVIVSTKLGRLLFE
jgi:hypothetical protein